MRSLALVVVLAACSRGEHAREAAVEHVVGLLDYTEKQVEAARRRQVPPVADAKPVPAAPDDGAPRPIDPRDAASSGPADAPVTLILANEPFDPYSARLDATLEQLRKAFPTQLRVVKMSFLVREKENRVAALGLCAAARQGPDAFQKLERRLWREKALPADGAEARLVALAGEVGLDLARFRADVADPGCVGQAEDEKARLLAAGVSRPATIVVNGRYRRARGFDELAAIVRQELTR